MKINFNATNKVRLLLLETRSIRSVVFLTSFVLCACSNQACVEDEYTNCSINKENYSTLSVGQNLDEVIGVFGKKNMLKKLPVGLSGVLEKTVEYQWVRCGNVCKNGAVNERITLRTSNGKVVSKYIDSF